VGTKKLKLIPKSNEDIRKEFKQMLRNFGDNSPSGWVEYWKVKCPRQKKQINLRATNGKDETIAEKLNDQ
jgi:hypothetical protein